MSTLFLGDCLDVMRKMDADSIDAIVTDPPYGLAFMGVAWDSFGGKNGSPRTNATFDQVGGNHHPTCAADQARTRKSENAKFQESMTSIFAEALRIAKPGAYLLAFGGTRTYHRLACAIEDAGWEVRDCIMWVYGSGFPKSMDVSKAIDKMRGAERTEVIGHENTPDMRGGNLMASQGKARLTRDITAPATPEAAAWSGWGTCLKPACEPIVIARKPIEGTVAANVLKYGTGAINIDGCRVPVSPTDDVFAKNPHTRSKGSDAYVTNCYGKYKPMQQDYNPAQGRFPANLIHDGSEEVLSLFPDTGKSTGGRTIKRSGGGNVGSGKASEASWTNDDPGFGDSGSAARFFYCAKASRSERGEGNVHPTVKPLALMRYLVRLVTRKGGLVLDPFMGSGTTGIAAVQEGMRFVGIEKDEHYYEIAQQRVTKAKPITSTTQQELPL